MKKIVYILFFLLATWSSIIAQPYGNEWIDFNNTYFKIKVGKEGIYRLTYSKLNSIGFPVSSIDPRKIQLFNRGVELAILVNGEDDASFDQSDYIEFYGQSNDGTLDAELYNPSTSQPHNYYNLYSDTTAYFLTYSPVENGKRMQSPALFTSGSIDTYHLDEILLVFTDAYARGYTTNGYCTPSYFTKSEGFTNLYLKERNTRKNTKIIALSTIDQPISSPFAPSPRLELLLLGGSAYLEHDVTIQVGASESQMRTLGTYQFNGYDKFTVDEPIEQSDLSSGTDLIVKIKVNDNGGKVSRVSISYVRLVYAQGFDMNSASTKKYYLEKKSTGGNDIQITNTPENAIIYDITSPENVMTVADTDPSPTIIKAGFANGTKTRILWVSNLTPMEPRIEPVLFRKMNINANYIIISHSSLMQPAGGFSNAVSAYAGYRASSKGGSFDTIVVDIQQLYDQFSFGEITPLAIFHFMELMIENGAPKKNLFIIGKALLVTSRFHRKPLSSFKYYDLVPTAGNPGSDGLFTSGLNDTKNEAAIPTGRLGASKPEDVINYLNKVIEHEALPFDKLWRKNIIHLSGGNNEKELGRFKGYINEYKKIAKSKFLGGNVVTVSKKIASPVEFINISKEVNAGVNQITFFGHSTTFTSDIDIGKVSNSFNSYTNKGKYPIILMNGCSSGNFYTDALFFGEDWVLTPNLGSIAVIAHSDYGYPTPLNNWSTYFYSIGYGDINFMNKSIGVIMNAVGKKMSGDGTLIKAQVHQMGLLGDPAIKLFGTQLPDYEISNSNIEPVEINNQKINSKSDSFALNLYVQNFAAYLNDSLEISVRRKFQDGTVVDYDTLTYSAIRNIDTVVYIVKNNYTNNYGINTFEIVLDPANKLEEINEFNNRVLYSYFIPTSTSINLTPLKFSIVPSQSLSLKAQVSGQPSESRTIEYQLDSVNDFTNPSNFIKNGKETGNLHTEWSNIALPSNDTTAYYWQSKYKLLKPEESSTWNKSSFTYIKNSKEGWAQVDYSQFKENSLTGLTPEENNKSFNFEEKKLPIVVETLGANHASLTYSDVELLIGDLSFLNVLNYPCKNNRLALVAFNHLNTAPYAPIEGKQIEHWTCGRTPQVINLVSETVAGTKRTLEQVLDAVSENDFVLLFTIGNFNFDLLPSSTIEKLEDFGSSDAVKSKEIEEPYIMFGKKGIGKGNAYREIVGASDSFISSAFNIKGNKGVGTMKSPLIGPSESWDKLMFTIKEITSNDDYQVDVIAKSLDGTVEKVVSSGNKINNSPLDLSTIIDSEQYPFIQLQYKVEDKIDKTPVQLDKWIVHYTPVAEGAIVYLGNNFSNKLQVDIQEGDSLHTEFGFVNVSNKLFKKPLQVEYTIFNKKQRVGVSKTIFIDPPAPNDTSKFKISIATLGLVDDYNLSVFVNNFIEIEQLYLNNLIEINNYFTVIKDETNPLIDVSFDGRYIYDGDIVAATPTILVKILDDNQFILKTDTTGIDLFMTYPCNDCVKKRIAFTNNQIDWSAATGKTPFEINYRPEHLENGIYTLTVQLKADANKSSKISSYSINFEVINESTVTNFYPYPNPFSTSVRFIFTLTGKEIFDEIMIRILSVSGKVVRTITRDEIGDIHIGNNQTDYAWDGRDEFGDQLANGVYLYKVNIVLNGEKVDFRPSAGDKGFKNGYGKLYLLR